MTFLVSMLILCGDTLTLTNGEIFVGKVVAQNEQRVWLKLGKGGILSFDRDRIATLEVSGAKARPKNDVPPPASVEKPKDGPQVTAPAPPAKAPAAARPPPSPPGTAPGPSAARRDDATRYLLRCPAGFERDHAAEKPPLVCVLREAATGARITLSAQPCRKGLAEAAERVRGEIGAALLAEREFRLTDAELDGRLFECDAASEMEVRGELQLVFVQGVVEWRLVGSVRKDLLEQYRDLFNDMFTHFNLTTVKAGEDAAPVPPPAKSAAPPAGSAAPPAKSAAPRTESVVPRTGSAAPPAESPVPSAGSAPPPAEAVPAAPDGAAPSR